MKNSFKIRWATVLGSALVLLPACSVQPETPVIPVPPVTSAPSVPDSATGIMRIADIDFASYSSSLAKWVDLEVGESITTATPKIETYFSPQNASDTPVTETSAKTETEFSTFGAEGGKVMLVERVNIRDDSVKAEQFYAIFKAREDSFVLADYGLKIKCHRGENTVKWQTAHCP